MRPSSNQSIAAGEWRPFLRLATLTLVVAIFALAQEVLVPIAMSGMLAFALSPAVKLLERRTGRAIAVAVVVLLALGSLSALGYLLKRQLVDLSTEMPKYSESIARKLASLRAGDGRGLAGLAKTVQGLGERLDTKVPDAATPRPVRIVDDGTSSLERLTALLTPVIEPLAKTVIVLVLVIFMLARREDIRDRFIRVLGRGNVTLTTRTFDEASHRISRFLVVQCAINGCLGVAIAVGLKLIGVPYAPLWGVMAAVLRFVPYVGTLLAMALPLVIAFAHFPGWWQAVATVALFLGLDSLAAYAVEPLIIGRRVGVSSMAMLTMAIFWTWLWGPIGLVLSTPLTVCVAVLGKQLPQYAFLAVLLGDERALEPELVFYQRLLAGDEDEAEKIVDKYRQATPSPQAAFDDIVVPAVVMAERELARGEIGEDEYLRFVRATETLVRSLEHPAQPSADVRGADDRRRIIGLPARNAAEEVLWTMLRQSLDSTRLSADSIGVGALASEVSAVIRDKAPDITCIVSLPPGGLAQARYLCRRIRAEAETTTILVLRPGTNLDPEASGQLIADGASIVVASLAEALTHIDQRLLLARPDAAAS